MADIRVERLRKTFGPVVALDDVSFSFADSQVTCLLGPSGCGKTTLMRIVAGLEQPTAGEVFFGGRRVTSLPPRKREIGMVFQYPVVYKGISVYRNIELPLLSEKLGKAERARRVEEVIALLGLEVSADKDVSALDNGTRQKVAVAREVARQPRIILFDEPITNVDAVAKLQLKRAFKELTRRLSQTIVYVTHDQTEAMTLADQIALMRDGRIVQCDAPRVLYNRPADRFGGWFLGNPGMAFFDAVLGANGDGPTLASPLFPAPVPVADLPPGAPTSITLGIRPEQIRVGGAAAPGAVQAMLLRKSISIGRQYLLSLRLPDGITPPFKAKVEPALGDALAAGSDVWVELPLDRVTLFDPSGSRLEARLGAGAAAPVAAPVRS
ncbi:MAG: Glycerol-3-phosphate ABC transporter, ATP-binding protein UgpC [uncultured Thermomicrobiales bacterium]|uniref:Glycerol-3-phosphate ABC transporter, ATP-binding protein UgpC n=1 Tax=uncultured Thermomicrobiales bacterium TaxID=1645740 RepID=A0A6J4V422_9BACT|nr:MAG: Glycerol-3-phosphate ABC transporter, ATP-binding protein UgpC [uncultured Thermomicrobiales bacterium]